MNPADCTCEHVHCSNSTCRSAEHSHGAVPESWRVYPANQGAKQEKAEQATAGVTTKLGFSYYDLR